MAANSSSGGGGGARSNSGANAAVVSAAVLNPLPAPNSLLLSSVPPKASNLSKEELAEYRKLKIKEEELDDEQTDRLIELERKKNGKPTGGAGKAAPAKKSGLFSGLFSSQTAGAGKASKRPELSLAAQGVTEELIEGDGTIFFYIAGTTTPLSFFTDVFTGADPPAGSVSVSEVRAGFNPFGQKNIKLTRQLAQYKSLNLIVKIEDQHSGSGYKVVIPSDIENFLGGGKPSVTKLISKIKTLSIIGDVTMSVLERDGHMVLVKQGGGYRRTKRRSNRRSKNNRKNKTNRKSKNNRKNRQSRRN